MEWRYIPDRWSGHSCRQTSHAEDCRVAYPAGSSGSALEACSRDKPAAAHEVVPGRSLSWHHPFAMAKWGKQDGQVGTWWGKYHGGIERPISISGHTQNWLGVALRGELSCVEGCPSPFWSVPWPF